MTDDLRKCAKCKVAKPLAHYGKRRPDKCQDCLDKMRFKKPEPIVTDNLPMGVQKITAQRALIPAGYRFCPGCKCLLPLDAFWRDRSRSQGVEYRCKHCRKGPAYRRNRAYYANPENREKIKNRSYTRNMRVRKGLGVVMAEVDIDANGLKKWLEMLEPLRLVWDRPAPYMLSIGSISPKRGKAGTRNGR